MKKTMAVSALAGLLFAVIAYFPGCSTVGCTVQHAAAGAITTGVANALQCTNGAQILADVTAVIQKSNICTLPAKKPGMPMQGAIANAGCPALIPLIVTEIGTAIPASWQCNPVAAATGISAALTQACELIPF